MGNVLITLFVFRKFQGEKVLVGGRKGRKQKSAMAGNLDFLWQKELTGWWSRGEDHFFLWPGEAHRAREKMTQYYSVWDSRVCLVGAVTQRVKLVLWLRSPQGKHEPAGTRPSMPQSSEVWGKNWAEKCGQGVECRPNFFCLV